MDTQAKRTPPITIRIPADLLERLKAQAEAEDRSLASLIVHYARTSLDRAKGAPT